MVCLKPPALLCAPQAWFPGSYANISSPFESLSALDYFVFLLNQLPTVAFSSTQLPAFIASDAKVRRCIWQPLGSLFDSR